MHRQLFFACVALIVVAAISADATTIVPAEFSDMVSGSHAIVHGTVVDVESRTTGDRRAIETVVTLAIADALKGPAATHVVFRVPGGTVGRYRRVMVGAPVFADGDEVVLFLRGRAPAMPMPFGLSQGVYRVNRTSSRTLVTSVMPSQPGRVVRGDRGRRPQTLEAFARDVRAAMERQ